MEIRSKEIRMIPIGEIVLNEKNRNIHPNEQIDHLVEQYKYQGFRSPLIVSNRSGKLVCGHGRYLAAKKAGLSELPVIFQDFESEEQEYAFGVAENATQSWSELDLSKINADIPELGPDFNVDMLGIKNFTIEALDRMLGDEDAVPQTPKEPKSKLGDLYELGGHRLLCGDSTSTTDLDRLMNGEQGDLLLTDPPYGVSYIEKNAAVHGGVVKNAIGKEIKNDSLDLDGMFQLWSDIFAMAGYFKDDASYYVFSPQGGELMMMMMQAIHQSDWQLKHTLIWVKQNFVFGRCDYHYRHEPILYGWKKKGTHNWYGDRTQDSVLQYDKAQRNDLHPTSKPVELLEPLVKNSSERGALIVDLFGGSGSTMIAAEKLGRRSFLMELDSSYTDVIVSRYCKYVGSKEVKRNGEPIIWELE